MITIDGNVPSLDAILSDNSTLAFLIIRDGNLVYDWYADGHDAATPSMLFSSSKSITSLLIGTAIEDGLIGSVDDPVSQYIPELADGGFDQVTIEDLLRMDSNSSYVEDDNPFAVHVEFNYTPALEKDILGLKVRDEPHTEFTYKSGDNAILGLILDRVLETSVTEYLETRLLHPMETTSDVVWSTDDIDGLERTWCCLALTASDFARFGQLVLNDGVWNGQRLISPAWLDASFEPAYTSDEWPSFYDESPLTSYGYQWWLVKDEAVVALGKDGQYLYVDLERNVIVVRTSTARGGVDWVDLMQQVGTG